MSQESFLNAYIECALWSSTDDDERPLDRNYTANDLHVSTRAKMRADCNTFYEENAGLWEGNCDDEQAGYDFWLTRNGHGTGFWDRDYSKKVRDRLTDAAHACGSCDLYVGDDGHLYV